LGDFDKVVDCVFALDDGCVRAVITLVFRCFVAAVDKRVLLAAVTVVDDHILPEILGDEQPINRSHNKISAGWLKAVGRLVAVVKILEKLLHLLFVLDDLLVGQHVAGGINEIVEAGLVGARLVGVDAQWKMTRGSKENLTALLGEADFEILHGDATALPVVDDCADAVVFDAPYGRQSKIARHELADLVGGALAEARRIADRAVVVADRSWEKEAGDAGWTVDRRFERRVHGTLVRHVHVLSG